MDQITVLLQAHLLPDSLMYCLQKKSRQQFTPTCGVLKVYPLSLRTPLTIIVFLVSGKGGMGPIPLSLGGWKTEIEKGRRGCTD